jgi:acyl-coenzyme A synthetase/AMP-(fatty) acid ligase
MQYSIIDLIDDKFRNYPDHIAIIYNDMNITYSELNSRANKLTNYLLEEGIRNEDVVAICLEKSLDVVIAILAIIKSGGAYLPIDVDCPEERFNYMIQDSKAKILLTKVDILSKFHNIKCKKLFLDRFNYEKYNSLNFKKTIMQKSLCYIIYTSGSTGQPKGVLIQHDGILNTLLSINKKLGVNESDKILALSKLTFDLSVYDILGVLIGGATVIMPDSLKSKDAEHWSSIVNKHGITIWNSVPQLAKLWQYSEELLFAERKYINRIRLFLLSGDVIQSNLPNLLKNMCSEELDIRCLGGATEASIWSIWHKKDDNFNGIIPYGKPMPNQYIYILDKMFNPVPIGVIGEICIGGIGIARGYLSKPELTAERFIANSFCKKSIGERIYRTGDIGKFLEDGTVIFIGRDDSQVKIRGYRIDLREIEVVLSSIKKVKQSFVTIDDDIVAYIVLKSPINNVKELLKQVCKDNLPDYMIPKHIIILDEIPITANGKIDKKQLAKPYEIESTNYEEPKNVIEQTLANIWMDLLRVDKISRKDNFFKLGGDSILSIQMVSRARKNEILLSVKQIFDTPTIEQLASNSKIINFNSTDEYEQGIVRLLPIQQWFFDNYKVLNHFNQASWFITDQKIDLKKLEDTINKIRYHHDSFRLRFKKEDSKWFQYYNKDFSKIKIQIEVDKLSEAEMIDKINSIHQTLDIINGPTDYVVWFNGYGLLWIIHHLIVDGVSWRILLDDLNILYSNNILPSKTRSYKFWSEYIYKYNNLDQTYEFYSEPIPNNVLFKQHEIDDVMVNEISINFSQEITSKFIKEAPECYNTQPNDLLLSALRLSIGDITGNYNISIDLEGHGRENLGSDEVDLSRTVGWFTSIYPVNINISNPENLSNTIMEIKGGLKKIPYKGLTYGIALINDKIKNQNSNILFNYLGQFHTNTKNDEIFRFGDHIKGDFLNSVDSKLYDLEINGIVSNNILSFWWKYNNSDTDQIVQIIDRFKFRLIQIVEHCINKENYNYTTSDFEADLDQEELNYITSLIEKI